MTQQGETMVMGIIIGVFFMIVFWFFTAWWANASLSKKKFGWLFKRLLNPFYRFGLGAALFATKRKNFINVLINDLSDRVNWKRRDYDADEHDGYFRKKAIWINKKKEICIHESWLRCLVIDSLSAGSGTNEDKNCVLDCTFSESVIMKFVLIARRIADWSAGSRSIENRRNQVFVKLSKFEDL